MNFDRNTVIGFIVLALLFLGFFYYNNTQQLAFQKQKAHQDSLQAASRPKPDTATAHMDSLQAAGYQKNITGGPDSTSVKLASSDFDKINYSITTAPNTTAEIANFLFSGGALKENADSSKTIRFELASGSKSIVHQFVIRPNSYMIDFDVQINGSAQLFSNSTLNLIWQNRALQLQKNISYERQQSQISYRINGDFDHSGPTIKNSSEDFIKPVNWVSVKQQFFNTTLVAKNNFASGNIIWTVPASDSDKTVVEATANLKIPLSSALVTTIPLAIYYGPTDYKTLKQYGNNMEEMVNLGSGIFSFVKYINRWIVLPIFDLFARFTSNFGIVILLLTLFIRLLISPLTYSSYLSGAKMKVLRPEIDKLKAKYGTDQQQMSVEQMKLFREAGVNPLGGCIPALFQIPIFFALYSFFNSNVALRGQSFLWAQDLSQADSIWDFGFNVPLLGDHLSLFTITAVTTSFLISLYSMSMTPDQGNPVLKYMPYFFPIILLFVFNKLPSGLTWYYTVSNVITLALQFVIQNYIINHDKILAKIEINRKKPKTKSKWQEKMEQIQQQQKQLKDPGPNRDRR
ncbi:MAG: membrane protein insertase YidC [Flavisolibacter sp.]